MVGNHADEDASPVLQKVITDQCGGMGVVLRGHRRLLGLVLDACIVYGAVRNMTNTPYATSVSAGHGA